MAASPLPPLVLTSPDLSPSPIPSAPPLQRTRRRPQRYPTRHHRTPPPLPAPRSQRRNEQVPEIAEQSRRPPSARSLEMNDVYLDTRRNMLSLVEDNIRLKMEIQTIKQDFFHVLHALQDYESAESRRNSLRPTPSVRDRVKVMYEARRARIMSRRNKENIPEAPRSSPPPPVPVRSPVVKVTLNDIAGDYVTLKSPLESERTMMTTSSSDETSVWVDSPSAVRNHMKRARESPMQYASSDTISEVYTSRSLKDVSGISLMSQSSLREQPSSLDSNQFFHSTFNYPLHSTLLHDESSSLIQAPDLDADPTGFSLSSYQTPRRQPSSQQLCKEHGIHPKIGTGPCIFQTDESTTMLSSSSGDFTDVDAEMSPPQTQPDTDCDSSYLSECVDDKMSEAEEEYTATYDQRRCRMRMLRRQTARPHLMTSRYPVGLSETDLIHDEDTLKHLSINATRSSLPDFSGLTTLVSNDESTLLVKTSSQENSTSSTLVLGDLDVALRITSSSDSSGARPTSGATTNTDESPENGLTVPVNSPNITDSGGSSSRPTTDSYDYVDIPKAVATKYNLPPPRARPQRPPTVGKPPTPHDLRSRSSRSSSGQSRARSQSSGRSRGAKSLDQALLHSYRAGPSTASRPESSQLCVRHLQMDCCYCGQASDQCSTKALQKDRKKVLAKKLKKFSNNFYRVNSTGNLHIQTLGHF
ncbi:hypothetical protein CAPTEDRAFT_207223 [Capitella teleta]|uniref:Uncharacterized protein n=1 Tax=Capitella teleta TaxID=283909 RepID=R7T6X1_CAPTE|nr:hypothetical protein CAPTEDRAFT_207223 [Capitella teleta]|eukprot:ELT89349.1 hypothetical protein CAPTEDRAFT_207223 [Capitella teleta]